MSQSISVLDNRKVACDLEPARRVLFRERPKSKMGSPSTELDLHDFPDHPDATQASERRVVVEAALFLVRKMGSIAAERGGSYSDIMTQEDSGLLRVDIDLVRSLLKHDEASGPIINDIDRFFPDLLPESLASARWTTWTASLGTLERLLETRLMRLNHNAFSASRSFTQSGSGPLASAVQSSESRRSPNQETFVARAIGNVLNSGGFKGLVLCLGAAVILAGAGSLVVRRETFVTAKDLPSTADAINDLVTAAKNNVDAEAKLLGATQNAVAESRRRFDDRIEEVKRDIREQAGDIKSDLAKVKDATVAEVIKKIQADLANNSKPLRAHVEAAVEGSSKSLGQAGTTSLEPLDQGLGELPGKLDRGETQQQTLQGSPDAPDRLTRQIDTPPALSQPVEPTLSKAEWKKIQRALKKVGWYTGHIDGDPGDTHRQESKTRLAVRDWQHSSGQPPTGRLTQPQIEQLVAPQRTAR